MIYFGLCSETAFIREKLRRKADFFTLAHIAIMHADIELS